MRSANALPRGSAFHFTSRRRPLCEHCSNGLPSSACWAPRGPSGELRTCLEEELLACHQIDKRKYGPNFKEIAAKYGDRKNAADLLAKKIRSGGTGVWGPDVMPPQPQVSAAEARALAQYVLSLK